MIGAFIEQHIFIEPNFWRYFLSLLGWTCFLAALMFWLRRQGKESDGKG